MQSVHKSVSLSIILLIALGFGFGLFLNSLGTNQLVQGALIDVFQNDSKVQQDMSRGESTITAEEFAGDVILFAEEVLLYPFYMIVIALFFSLIGLLMIATNPPIAAALFVLAGVFSFFTLVPPLLLFFAAKRLVKTVGVFSAMPKKNAI